MNVLLSIKPEFAEKILSGEKQYEFRKTPICKADRGDEVVLYASSPVQKLVGAFTMDTIVEAHPMELWERFHQESGINDPERFFDYFGDNERGYAVEVNDARRFDAPINPYECIDGFRPPVSFKYLNGQLSNGLNLGINAQAHEVTRSTCD